MSIKKPFGWYGGKQALAPLLVSLLPAHRVYCEVFGGSGALLFAKPPSALEIFNDLDSGVVNFFRVLRKPGQFQELQQQLSLTPYAREEYYSCSASWQDTSDPVEKARAWYVAVMQSMNARTRNTDWSTTKHPGSNHARKWQHSIVHLSACIERLRDVQIEHRDFEQVILAYDSSETYFYLDPPYVPQSRRKKKMYCHEMSEDDHKRLLHCILHVEGMVLLSGYSHTLYEEALSSWESITLDARCPSIVTSANGALPETTKRIERIWMNPACVRNQTPRQQVLFGASPEREVHT
jgi:DNA adenine methylase